MFQFDEKFLRKLKSQDHHTFNQFYTQTVGIFFRYIKSNYFVADEEAEDIVSHYFVKQWDAFKSLNLKKSFSAYVWTIFKNTIKDYFKKHADLPFTLLDGDEEGVKFEDQLEHEDDIQDILELDFQMEEIERAIQHLDDTSKDIVYLKYIEEKSFHEIADFLQLSHDNVRQKCSRAIKHIKNLIGT